MTAFSSPMAAPTSALSRYRRGRQPLQEHEDFGVPASFRGVAHESGFDAGKSMPPKTCSTVAAESAGGRCDAARWRS
jgi:hypothetical protein